MSGFCNDDEYTGKTYPAGRLEWDMASNVWAAYVKASVNDPDVFLGTHKTLEGARDLVYDWVLEQEGGKE
jgi:hypothetical protein